MARIKNEEENKVNGVPEVVTGETQIENPETTENPETVENPETTENPETVENPETTENPEKTENSETTENPETGVKVEKTETGAIEPTDAGILKTLKCFPELDEAYVDSIGSVFTKDTPVDLVGRAVLYKNPYFNK